MARRRRKTPSYKLPDSALSPTQLRNRNMIRRRRRQDRDPLYNPQAVLSGSRLSRAVDQIVAGQFEPVERGLRQEATDRTRQGTALQGRAADYYKTLAEQEQRGVQTQQALGNMLSTQLGSIGSQAAQAAAAAADAERQRLASDEAVRGPGLQDTSTLKETAILGANAQQTQAAALTQAAQGTSTWGNFANALAQARGLRGGEIQERLGNRLLNANQRTEADLRDLAIKRGGARSDTLLKLRQQGFENLATAQTLGLKEAELEAASKPTPSEQKTKAELAFFRKHGYWPPTGPPKPKSATERKTEADLAFFREHGYYPSTGRPGGGPAGETPAQRAKRRAMPVTINTAAAKARTLRSATIPVLDAYDKPTGKRRKPTEAEIRAQLRDTYKDRDIANAAMDLAILTYLSPENERRLRARNIPIPKDWLSKRPKPKWPRGAVGVAVRGRAPRVRRKPPVPLG